MRPLTYSPRTALLVTLALVVASCERAFTPVLLPGPFIVEPAKQWSGGVISLRTDYDISTNPPDAYLGTRDKPLEFLGVSGTVASYRLPVSVSRSDSILVVGQRGSTMAGPVEVVGYDSVTTAAGYFWLTAAWPWHDPAAVIGTTEDRRVATVELSSGAVTKYSSVKQYGYDPGLSYQPTAITTLAGPQDTVFAWRLGGGAGAAPLEPVNIWHWDRHVFQLSPSAWMVTSHHVTQTYIRDSSSTSSDMRLVYSDFNESPWGIVFSRRGDRAALVLNVNSKGVPVFDLISADTAFHVPQLRGASYAAFSSDGEVLYLVSNSCCQPGDLTLVAVEATKGQLLASLSHPEPGFPESGLAVDPRLPYVYWAVQEYGKFKILVLDAATLERVGTLAMPEELQPCGSCRGVTVAPIHDRSIYHVVAQEGEIQIYRFDRL